MPVNPIQLLLAAANGSLPGVATPGINPAAASPSASLLPFITPQVPVQSPGPLVLPTPGINPGAPPPSTPVAPAPTLPTTSPVPTLLQDIGTSIEAAKGADGVLGKYNAFRTSASPQLQESLVRFGAGLLQGSQPGETDLGALGRVIQSTLDSANQRRQETVKEQQTARTQANEEARTGVAQQQADTQAKAVGLDASKLDAEIANLESLTKLRDRTDPNPDAANVQYTDAIAQSLFNVGLADSLDEAKLKAADFLNGNTAATNQYIIKGTADIIANGQLLGKTDQEIQADVSKFQQLVGSIQSPSLLGGNTQGFGAQPQTQTLNEYEQAINDPRFVAFAKANPTNPQVLSFVQKAYPNDPNAYASYMQFVNQYGGDAAQPTSTAVPQTIANPPAGPEEAPYTQTRRGKRTQFNTGTTGLDQLSSFLDTLRNQNRSSGGQSGRSR